MWRRVDQLNNEYVLLSNLYEAGRVCFFRCWSIHLKNGITVSHFTVQPGRVLEIFAVWPGASGLRKVSQGFLQDLPWIEAFIAKHKVRSERVHGFWGERKITGVWIDPPFGSWKLIESSMVGPKKTALHIKPRSEVVWMYSIQIFDELYLDAFTVPSSHPPTRFPTSKNGERSVRKNCWKCGEKPRLWYWYCWWFRNPAPIGM